MSWRLNWLVYGRGSTSWLLKGRCWKRGWKSPQRGWRCWRDTKEAGAGEPWKKPGGREAGGASFLHPLELDNGKTFILTGIRERQVSVRKFIG